VRNSFLALITVACLASCTTLEPAYERPPAPIPSRFPDGAAYKDGGNTNSTPASQIGWRDFLVDPRLQRLVEIALRNNRDLRVAALKRAPGAGAVPHPALGLVSVSCGVRGRIGRARAGKDA